MPWTSQFVSIVQNAEPHDAAAPSGVHNAKANESFFTVPPQRWNCRKTATLLRIQRQEESGGARGGKGENNADGGATATAKPSKRDAHEGCRAQDAGAAPTTPGSPKRMHEGPRPPHPR